LGPVAAGYPSYGTSDLASPGEATYLRIVRRTREQNGTRLETYTAYSSHDGVTWRKGSTWRHTLGEHARIGLVSMGGAGYTTSFEYVRMYALK
jgi:arabinan endo-1,5-alpha-L-arabinosidase